MRETMNDPSSPRNVIVNGEKASRFPFMRLPRELRDQVYNQIFSIPDSRGDRALRIERRHLKYFSPSAPTVLLILHHESLLLSRQICREAIEILFKNHTVFLSCGPYVLKQLLAKIEEAGGPPKQWLQWIRRVELDWVTFPNLRVYPPERRGEGKDEWWWEQEYVQDGHEVDCIRGAQYNAHYDEHDYEGGDGYYDDNFYGAEEPSLYPSWPQHATLPSSSRTNNPTDPFGLSTHYPFRDPTLPPTPPPPSHESSPTNIDAKLSLLISLEVSPLFTYLSESSIFPSLRTLTLPLYFVSKPSLHARRSASRSSHALPLKLRYWVHVLAHALRMLQDARTPLEEVRVKYMPWDIWASMDPADDLARMEEKGVWFAEGDDDDDDGVGGGMPEREGEGEAFRMVWRVLRDMEEGGDGEVPSLARRRLLGQGAEVRLAKWDGDLDGRRVGDELEVVFKIHSMDG